MPKRMSHHEYVAKVRKIHGKSITVLSEYTKCDEPVRFRCAECEYEWETRPIYVSQGSKCPRCTGKMRMTHEEYIRKVKLAHGDQVKVIGKYKNNMHKIKHYCAKCENYFSARPSDIQRGTGCVCNGNFAKKVYSNTWFLKRLKLRNTRGITPLEKYQGKYVKIKCKCSKGHTFKTKPANLLDANSGCPKCAHNTPYSLIAIEWLEEIANRYNIRIQHAKNGGEYVVPGTKYRCDGFHKESNTVFEFHGDIFHGNPKRYKKTDKPNPFSQLTALQLYRKTKAKEKALKELGYFLCTIWESDYRNTSKEARSRITI